jgi:V8-like Glu-specific endopeptidase
MKTTISMVAALLLTATAAQAGSATVFQNSNAAAKPLPVGTSDTFSRHVNKLAAPSTSLVLNDPTGIPKTAGVSGGTATARAYGSFGVPYTSTRVRAGATRYASTIGLNYLQTTYPYRAVGLLQFDTGFGQSICTATVIKRGLVVTAAHCIQDFAGGATRFDDWTFTPAYYGVTGSTATQRAPYGSWIWKGLVVPSTWSNGSDVGSGSARNNDLAIIAFGPDNTGKFVGDYTGKINYAWNGYGFVTSARTGNVAVAAVTTLGYPGLLDNAAIMQRTDGPTYMTTVGNAKQYLQGSNFTGGSSGGPWIVNFASSLPALSGGAVIGTAPNMAIIGVTSWGAADPNAPKDNYASRFGVNVAYPNSAYGSYGPGNIGFLLNTICSAKPSGSASTYAQLGYCT